MQSLNLQKCCDELLDLGKRNKLLYFSQSSSILKVFSYLKDGELFASFLDGKGYQSFDLDGYQQVLGLTYDFLDTTAERMRFYAQARDYYLLSSLKEKSVLLTPRKGALTHAIKRIVQSATESLEERGINTLYLAFGSLLFQDTSDNETILSPLLLMPAELVRINGSRLYTLSMNQGEEIQVNSTLKYKLNQTYGLKLPDFDSEQDTYDSYLSKIKELIKDYDGWSIKEGVYVGIFAFSKIDMYHDLKDHEEKLLKNHTIQELFSLPLTEEEEEMPASSHPGPLHNVVDADSSQCKAIKASKMGRSFVLEGPPGTGKSQTITNIIAEALYEGKRVLFVSEKKAALDVVYHKLEQARLSDFCLPLHGNKANKKEVLYEINRVLNMDYSSLAEGVDRKLKDLLEESKVLENYRKDSGKVVPALSLPVYQVLGKAIYFSSYSSPSFRFAEIEKKDFTFHQKALLTLGEIQNITSQYGRNEKEYPFYGIKEEKSGYEDRISLEVLLDHLLSLSSTLKANCDSLVPFLHSGNTISGMRESLHSIQLLRSLPIFDSAFFSKERLPLIQKEIDQTIDTIKLRDEAKDALLEKTSEEFLLLDGKAEMDEMIDHWGNLFRIFKPSYYKKKKELSRKAGKNLSYEEMLSLTKELKEYQNKEKKAKDALSSFVSLLQSRNSVNEEELPLYQKSASIILEIREDYYFANPFSKESYQQFLSDSEKVTLSNEDLSFVDDLSLYFDDGKVSLKDESIDKILYRVSLMKENFSLFAYNLRLTKALSETEKEGYRDFVDSYLSSSLPLKEMISAFEKCFYTQWSHYLLSTDSLLSSFVYPKDENAVSDFIRDDKTSFLICQALIRQRCTSRIPAVYTFPGGIVHAFLQEANKKRNLPSIRLLMNRYGSLVQTVKPCFMMSPLTVASFLGENMEFDLVVFDEASQVFPWDAIGAIYRAKQCIIVGDRKQMPPTSFFLAGMSDEDETGEESSDIASYESILDFAGTLPHYRLNWHYRSKSEELIAFSNANFYDGKLVTFPSARKKKEGFGVDFIPVTGTYERKHRTNSQEAEKVVDVIVEDIRNYPEDSLGVVCMNISQQEKIQDLLEERAKSDEVLKDFISRDSKEPLFIKNLETVQGDERDRIIFSVGYGKDEEGKLYHNFGPLNRQGGERRLNVAITRAKYNVQVVSSLHSYDIQEGRVSSLGPRLLRQYLDYAENGIVMNQKEQENHPVLPTMEEVIADFLLSEGYQVERNLGTSGYRIDLAVSSPLKEEYLLAIECDTDAYHSMTSVRDRERLRKEVLIQQGWNYLRVCSVDFFLHPEETKERIRKKLLGALNGEKDENLKLSDGLLFEKKTQRECQTLDSRFEEFVPYDVGEGNWQIPSAEKSTIYTLFDRKLEEIIQKEGVICETRLLKILASLSGRACVSSIVKEVYAQVMRNDHHPMVHSFSDPYSTYYWLGDKTDFPFHRGGGRTLEEVPGVEIESALFKIVVLTTCISKDDLIRAFYSIFSA